MKKEYKTPRSLAIELNDRLLLSNSPFPKEFNLSDDIEEVDEDIESD